MENHGGNVHSWSNVLGIPKKELLDFSASINPTTPKNVKKELIKNLWEISLYPDPENRELKKAISDYIKIPKENIILGNGSTELIYASIHSLCPKRALLVSPIFSEHLSALKSVGAKISRIDTFPDTESKNIKKAIFYEIDRSSYDVLIVSNPNSPCGYLIDMDEMFEISDFLSDRGVFFVVDEAFIDFCETHSLKNRAISSKNILVIRSLTKFFAIPGLRVGYMVGPKYILERVSKNLPPWSVNRLAQIGAEAALRDGSYVSESLDFIRREKEYLWQELSKIPKLKCFKGVANFIICKVEDSKKDALLLKDFLLKNFILIRECSNFPPLDASYFRISVRRRRENKKIVALIREFMLK